MNSQSKIGSTNTQIKPLYVLHLETVSPVMILNELSIRT